MTRYTVSATISFPAWVSVEADTPEEAQDEAAGTPTSSFEYDTGGGEVEFNVFPAVEVEDD